MNSQTIESKERLSTSSPLYRLFLVRHGEQENYEDTYSVLSMEGRIQITQFAHELSAQFQREGNKKIILPVTSPRLRTIQSVQQFSRTLNQDVIDGHLRGIKVEPYQFWAYLQTADAIEPLLANGTPKTEVCSQWLDTSEYELNTTFMAESPKQIATRLFNMVNFYEVESKQVENSGLPWIEYNIVGLTHEPTFWALLHCDPAIDATTSDVKHAEHIQIDIAHRGLPTSFKFRGQQFYPNGAFRVSY